MKNLPALKPREVIRAVEKLGFVKDRSRGSHVIFYFKKAKTTDKPVVKAM